MDALRRTKNLLAKAQRLADLLEASGELTNGERDLMLAYLRDVYDVFAADTQFVLREQLQREQAAEALVMATKTVTPSVENTIVTPKNDWDGLIATATNFLENTKPVLPLDPIDVPQTEPLVAETPIIVPEIIVETPVAEPPTVVETPKVKKNLPIVTYDDEDAPEPTDGTFENLICIWHSASTNEFLISMSYLVARQDNMSKRSQP
jgi:hypothetical protein